MTGKQVSIQKVKTKIQELLDKQENVLAKQKKSIVNCTGTSAVDEELDRYMFLKEIHDYKICTFVILLATYLDSSRKDFVSRERILEIIHTNPELKPYQEHLQLLDKALDDLTDDTLPEEQFVIDIARAHHIDPNTVLTTKVSSEPAIGCKVLIQVADRKLEAKIIGKVEYMKDTYEVVFLQSYCQVKASEHGIFHKSQMEVIYGSSPKEK